MTFKNIEFDDSVTMRSLVRVAQKRGWLKEQKISKVAYPQNADLSTTNNVTENIMKLCRGLREIGLEAQATELENKFVLYKQAKAVKYYKVFKETGEDLIHDAHPQGSHKMENLGNDATVETIIDQHLEIVKMVNKEPTGKLAHKILNQVKMALSEEKKKILKIGTPNSEQVSNYSAILGQAASMLNNLATKLETAPEDQIGLNWEDPSSIATTLRSWAGILNNKVKNEVSTGDTTTLWRALDNIKNVQRNNVQIFNRDNKDANRIAMGMIDNIVYKLEQISWSIQHPDYTPPNKEYQGSTFSKSDYNYPWDNKYIIPEEKTKVEDGNFLPGVVNDFKSILNIYANQIQKNVLNKEEEIYAPIPDNDTNKLAIMDQAFDRAENLKNQLFSISSGLKGQVVEGIEKLTKEQLTAALGKFSMFKNKQFNSADELATYLSKIQKSIYDAIGIK